MIMLSLLIVSLLGADPVPHYSAEFVFPLNKEHNHAPGIVECPNGDLLVTWYRGAGERTADDVRVLGSRKAQGADSWTEPVVWADTPGFPDCNTALFIDDEQHLWLFYPTIIANTWESCLTNFKMSSDYYRPGVPNWNREGIILLKPDDFTELGRQLLDREFEKLKPKLTERQHQIWALARERLGDKLYQRLGWQPRCKPTQLPNGRLLLPLYSDTYNACMMAITDDEGRTWKASQPIIGFGNIQATVLRRDDGTLIAYMRENGYTHRIRAAESTDDGMTWGPVYSTNLPNPGAGIDGMRLRNGHWFLVYNDTEDGRNKLAVSISTDEGRTWPITRRLEDHPDGSYHYPACTQAADGTIHVIYSYFVKDGKSMKHVALNEAWIQARE